MVQALVDSYKSKGGLLDIHAFTDRQIDGAINHPIEKFDKQHYLFKIHFLKNFVKKLGYDYYIFLDADTYCVRPPEDFLDLLCGDKFHVFMESDCTGPLRRDHWRDCPISEYVRLMRECGVEHASIFNINAGMFIVAHEAIDVVCGLAEDFWEFGYRNGYVFTEEAPLAYAAQMLYACPEDHLLWRYPEIWASDWEGHFMGKLPVDEAWQFHDYLTFESHEVHPALVHAIRSKEMLIAAGKARL